MNSAAAVHAYTKMALTARSGREIEAEAFSKAIGLLSAAETALSDFQRYAEALRFNCELWTIIQADVASPDNPLPSEIRQNVLQLSLFVDKQTLRALTQPDGALLKPLIEINRQLLEGLRQKTSTPSGSQPA